jgi:hypothetical protein
MTRAAISIGHNNPPEPTPYEAMKIHIEDLFDEAKNFLDGEPVTTQEMADAIDKLKAMALEAEKDGDGLRKVEAKPFDDGKKEVQERWNPLVNEKTGKCRQIISTCNTALAPFLKAKQDAINAEAARQQKIADDLAAEALAKHKAANLDNLADKDEAEQALKVAAQAQRLATQTSSTRAQAKGGRRATSLRDVYTPELTDAMEALKHYRADRPETLKAWLIEQAEGDIFGGVRAIPGFNIKHDQVAR